MYDPINDPPKPPSGRQIVWRAWERLSASRTVSFYLLFAMMLAVMFGLQMVYLREDPRRFALFLILNFIFFTTVILVAALDGIAIVRRSFREREQLFHHTLGDDRFIRQLQDHLYPRRPHS